MKSAVATVAAAPVAVAPAAAASAKLPLPSAPPRQPSKIACAPPKAARQPSKGAAAHTSAPSRPQMLMQRSFAKAPSGRNSGSSRKGFVEVWHDPCLDDADRSAEPFSALDMLIWELQPPALSQTSAKSGFSLSDLRELRSGSAAVSAAVCSALRRSSTDSTCSSRGSSPGAGDARRPHRSPAPSSHSQDATEWSDSDRESIRLLRAGLRERRDLVDLSVDISAANAIGRRGGGRSAVRVVSRKNHSPKPRESSRPTF